MDSFSLRVLLFEEMVDYFKVLHPLLVVMVEPHDLNSLWHCLFFEVFLGFQSQCLRLYFKLITNHLEITTHFLLSLRVLKYQSGNLRG